MSSEVGDVKCWVPDEAAPACMNNVCGKKFGMLVSLVRA
jgi:hypothetical protein